MIHYLADLDLTPAPLLVVPHTGLEVNYLVYVRENHQNKYSGKRVPKTKCCVCLFFWANNAMLANCRAFICLSSFGRKVTLEASTEKLERNKHKSIIQPTNKKTQYTQNMTFDLFLVSFVSV